MTTIQGRGFGLQVNADVLMMLLRVTLGVIFIIGGIKLAFLGETSALVASYINPAKGWISAVFADKITQTLGVSLGAFLRSQGLIEILLGVLMVLGLGSRIVAVILGLMFWSFTVANPVVGEIRLSRDIALMGLCFAVALSGGGAWSVDRRVWGTPSMWSQHRNTILLLMRLSLAYTLLASAIFASGPFANHLNTTLPVVVVLLLGVLLAVGVRPHWIMGLLGVWMLYVVGMSLAAKGFYFGLDSAKRELGFLLASVVYTLLGPDHWPWSQATSAPQAVVQNEYATSRA